MRLFRPYIHGDAEHEVLKVLESGWIGLGPKVEEFEKMCASYLKAQHVVAFNSGTAALQAAVHTIGNPWGPIVSTPNTFVSTNHVILQEGFDVAFADIEGDTGNMSLESLKRTIYVAGAQAVMVVHYGGQPVDLDEIYDLGYPVIEDAAHAFGANYNGRMIGERGKYVCFSFHAVKPLGIGDGGLLATDSAEVAETARRLRWLGIDKSTLQRHTGSYKWDYDVTDIGYKSHMNDIQAAIGIGQLKHFEEDQIYRQKLVNAYIESLPVMKGCRLLTQKPYRHSSHHLMVFQATSKGMRDEIMWAMMREGYETGMHYKPNYLYSMYKDCYRDRDCPNMEQFYKLSVSLPLHLNMWTCDVYAICSIVRSVVGSYGKGVK